MADRRRRKQEVEEFEEFEEFQVPAFEAKEEEEPEEETSLQPVAEQAVEAAEEARYFIDQQWYDDRGLSFSAVAQSRLCYSCSGKLGTFTEERYPVIDPKTKRVTFEFRKVPYAANPLPIIRDCCSRSRDYVTPETPLLEAIFRVFLANGNQPMTPSTIREHLLTFLPEMAALRSDYPVELIERLIQNDRMYGLQQQELPLAV
jgi:hypothetical protein